MIFSAATISAQVLGHRLAQCQHADAELLDLAFQRVDRGVAATTSVAGSVSRRTSAATRIATWLSHRPPIRASMSRSLRSSLS